MSKLYLLGMSENWQSGRRFARHAACEKTASNRALRLVLDIRLMLRSASLSKKSGWGSFEIGG
jgi:hypothetical protein